MCKVCQGLPECCAYTFFSYMQTVCPRMVQKVLSRGFLNEWNACCVISVPEVDMQNGAAFHSIHDISVGYLVRETTNHHGALLRLRWGWCACRRLPVLVPLVAARVCQGTFFFIIVEFRCEILMFFVWRSNVGLGTSIYCNMLFGRFPPSVLIGHRGGMFGMRCAVEYQLKSLALEVNVNRKSCPYIKSFFRQPSTHERVLQLHCYIPLMIDQGRGLLIALIRQHTEVARGFELLPPIDQSAGGYLCKSSRLTSCWYSALGIVTKCEFGGML